MHSGIGHEDLLGDTLEVKGAAQPTVIALFEPPLLLLTLCGTLDYFVRLAHHSSLYFWRLRWRWFWRFLARAGGGILQHIFQVDLPALNGSHSTGLFSLADEFLTLLSVETPSLLIFEPLRRALDDFLLALPHRLLLKRLDNRALNALDTLAV